MTTQTMTANDQARLASLRQQAAEASTNNAWYVASSGDFMSKPTLKTMRMPWSAIDAERAIRDELDLSNDMGKVFTILDEYIRDKEKSGRTNSHTNKKFSALETKLDGLGLDSVFQTVREKHPKLGSRVR